MTVARALAAGTDLAGPDAAPGGALPSRSLPEVNSRSVGAAFAAGMGYLVGPTVIIGPPLGLFLLPVSAQFNLSRSHFALMMCMVASLVGVASPFAGRAIDRLGVRRVVLPAVLLFGLTEIALGYAHSFLQYLAIYAFIGVLAGVQNPIAYTKVVSMWFSQHRGIVLAIVGAVGGGGGGMLIPQLTDQLIRAGGWRLGYTGLGVFIVALGVPSLLVCLHQPGEAPRPLAGQSAAAAGLPGLSRKQALRTPHFWMILVAVSLVAGSVGAISVHMPAMLGARDVGSHLPAVFLSLFALGSVIGQFVTGTFLDRIDSPKVGAPFFIVALAGAVLLWRCADVDALALAGGFMAGAGFGAELGLACYYVSRFFGLRAYGEIYGVVYGATVAASAFGPFLAGVSFDLSGSYTMALAAISVAISLCVILVLLLPAYVFPPERVHLR